MPYGRYSRRRFSRRRKATIPGSIRQVRPGAIDNNGAYAYRRGACKQLIHLHPPASAGDASLRFANTTPLVITGGAASNQTAQFLNGIGQQTGVNNRLNNRIFMRYLMIRGVATGGDTDVPLRQNLRLLVVYSPISRGAAPLTEDILGPFSTLGFRPDEHKTSIQVLYDTTWVSVPNYEYNGTSVASQFSVSSNRLFQLKIPIFRTATYNGIGSTSADVETGSLWLVALADVVAAATQPRFFFRFKLSFTDLD